MVISNKKCGKQRILAHIVSNNYKYPLNPQVKN